jgi:predicted membrane-bound spermidine synthase
MAGIVTGVVALVTAVVGLIIIDEVVSGTAFSTALLNTIVENITTLAAVSTLALAGMWLFMK